MVVTLLTDFGLEDEYAGVMKGVILSINPCASVVDLCHRIPPGDVEQAGWILSWSWRFFPKGSVHVAVVDPGVGSSRKILLVRHQGHLFLAPDNGLLTPVLGSRHRVEAYWVKNRRLFLPRVSRTFHGRDIFAPVAARLSTGMEPGEVGPRIRSIRRLPMRRPIRRLKDGLEGCVIQIDRFGNAVTNLAEEILRGVKGRLRVCVNGARMAGPQRAYGAVAEGSPLAIIGSRGLLEIAVCRGSAAEALGLRVGDAVKVERAR